KVAQDPLDDVAFRRSTRRRASMAARRAPLGGSGGFRSVRAGRRTRLSGGSSPGVPICAALRDSARDRVAGLVASRADTARGVAPLHRQSHAAGHLVLPPLAAGVLSDACRDFRAGEQPAQARPSLPRPECRPRGPEEALQHSLRDLRRQSAGGPGPSEPLRIGGHPRLSVPDLVRRAVAVNPRIPETALSFLLAAAFALAGDLLLAKRSSKLREWIESLLVGAGVSAAALFPLSLAFPGYALGALALLLAAAAVTSIFVRYRARGLPKAGAPRPRVRPDPSSIVFFTITLLAGLAFAVLNWRYVYLWDGFQIWAAKAQLLFYQGDLKANLASGDYLNLKLAYPALVPMFEALLSKLRGGFDFNSLKPLFTLFYLSIIF